MAVQNKTGFRQSYEMPQYEMPVESSGGYYNIDLPDNFKEVPRLDAVPVPFREEGGDDDRNNDSARRDLALAANTEGLPVHSPDWKEAWKMAVPFGLAGSPKGPYGTEGTVSGLTGGVFDKNGRSFNPISGYANQEYKDRASWTDRMFGKGAVRDFWLGDKPNAYDYKRYTGAPILERQFAEAKGLDTNIETNPAWTKDLLLQTNISPSSYLDSEGDLQKNNPTVLATNMNNYVMVNGKLVAPPGSQLTKTGGWFQGKMEDYENLLKEQKRGKYANPGEGIEDHGVKNINDVKAQVDSFNNYKPPAPPPPTIHPWEGSEPSDNNDDGSQTSQDQASVADDQHGMFTSMGGHIKPRQLNKGGHIGGGK